MNNQFLSLFFLTFLSFLFPSVMTATIKQRPFCDQRLSMKSNYLLQKTKVGKVPPCPYPLPDDDYAYGISYHDDYGVKEIFDNYKKLSIHQPKKRKSKRISKMVVKRDFVATNKAALKAGCVTAREYDEYRHEHMIPVQPEENYNVTSDQLLKYKQRNMVHGVQYHIENEMKKCLEYQYGRDAVEKAREKQRIRQEKLASPTNKMSKAYSRRLLTTRATRGHSVKPEPQPSYADTFKMKRFLAIDRYAIEDKW
ncbi:hypothetical protein TRFO_34241 [Tritrichomonas foetus]|uniref:Uncharacterized protein n=1 Tax=Tritrichomonas foetus TaxID=1144522 RepID=A0A1J4JJK5_9EUKA|nr:hypothetical protein TRFO_34241 [Tritrichomonas foetus]|eukprot:OHS99336.1 hypothetical protein TRFO_34241 [Tritrichomonas foetus]